MSVRRKLIFLHAAFAAFAVCATAATIYGVQFHVQNALGSLEQFADESNLVDHLRVEAQRHVVCLHEIVDGRRTINAAYLADRDAFFTQLTEAATFRGAGDAATNRSNILALADSLRRQFDRCISLTRAKRLTEAATLLDTRIERDLLPALNTRLQTAKRALDGARRSSIDDVFTSSTQLLMLAILISAAGACFVLLAASLVRRWLIAPITDLQGAAAEFSRGNLDYRIQLDSNDEFQSLAASLNEMAGSLDASQTKYQSLFDNLRDAIIICEPDGRVVECRDSDTGVLSITPGAATGGSLSDIWPGMESSRHAPEPAFAGRLSKQLDWFTIIADVADRGMYYRASDVEIRDRSGDARTVDVLAYPVEYRKVRHAAVLVRDVTDRRRLQRLAQRAETIEAAETFAHGIAHDFKNLLNSAVTTLSLLESQATDAKSKTRIHTAFQACCQAAGLARRLLGFAGSDPGRPELINLSETVELILGSLDEPLLAPLRIRTRLDPEACVRMDKDQLTQIILNLIINAAEAMPDGGALHLGTETRMSSDPLGHGAPSPHAVLRVRDTGRGMEPEVKKRLFEPLFSTKPRGAQGVRGMGLAVVYSAVRHADGFIQVESTVGKGTTFDVFLPSPQPSRTGKSPTRAAPRIESDL